MNILLDTVAFVRLATEPERLSREAQTLCKDPVHTLFLSAVSSGEIALKYRLRKIPLPIPPSSFIPTQRLEHSIQSLPLDEAAGLLLESLPPHHKDPFDRLLICQALAHDLTILTPDKNFRKYKVKVAW